MENKFPSRFPEASRIVIQGLLDLARRQPEMARALQELHVWFGRELAASLGPLPTDSSSASDPAPGVAPLGDKVVSIGDERRVVRLTPHVEDGRRERRGIDLERVAERAAGKAAAYAAAADSPPGPQAVRAAAERLSAFSEELPTGLESVLVGRESLPAGRGLDVVAACYANVSLAARVVLGLRQNGRLDGVPPTALLYLLAEAQSALLSVLVGAEVYSDTDQHDLFLWLKDQTTRHRIYVDRHMRLDDPADCTAHEELAVRLRAFETDLEARERAEVDRKRLLSKLRFHCRKVCENDDFAHRDWEALVESAADWRQAGYPTAEATAAIAGLRKHLPPDLEVPEGLQQLLRNGNPTGHDRARERVDLLERATELLSGRTVTLFGGRERESARTTIAEAFKLSELRWVELEAEGIESQLAREIERPEVNMVLIAMRLPGPLYEVFKELCLEHKKPFVRLPNGCAPGQVAQQVLRQVGRRLKPLEPASS